MELNVIRDLIPLLDANSEGIVTASAEALRLLCSEPAAEQMIVDNSGLSALVRVLSRGSAVITNKSPIPAVLGVMSQLCNSRTACDRLVKFGVIHSMKSMLQRDMDGVCQARILKLLERITTSQSQDRCYARPARDPARFKRSYATISHRLQGCFAGCGACCVVRQKGIR